MLLLVCGLILNRIGPHGLPYGTPFEVAVAWAYFILHWYIMYAGGLALVFIGLFKIATD